MPEYDGGKPNKASINFNMKIKLRTSAKINLYLNILGRRGDGYHEIDTMYQPISLYDEVVLSKTEGGIEIEGDDSSIPWDERNICVRAAREIIEKMEINGGVGIKIKKRIPAGSGLGGGSSDAAATIIGIDRIYGLNLSEKELMEIASRVGSDVPFFVYGRPATGQGRGGILKPAIGLTGGWILIVKPDVSISTKWAYRNLNKRLTKCFSQNRIRDLKEGLKKFPEFNLKSCNSFEELAVRHFPEVKKILDRLKKEKAVLCSLSGSGSACFAVFSEESNARKALKQQVGKWSLVKITRPVSRTIEIIQEY